MLPAQGRLTLLSALITALDRRALGSPRGANLVSLLLDGYLFPEAALAAQLGAGHLDLSRCAARLAPRCASPSARRAAFGLVTELMRDSLGVLTDGAEWLQTMMAVAAPRGFDAAPPRAVRRPGEFAGLRNAGATCYMNSVFQQLFMQPRIRALVLGAPAPPADELPDSVFGQLQAAFAAMALGLRPFHVPDGFWRAFKDYDGRPIDTREHQDAYEFFTRLQVGGVAGPAPAPVLLGRTALMRCSVASPAADALEQAAVLKPLCRLFAVVWCGMCTPPLRPQNLCCAPAQPGPQPHAPPLPPRRTLWTRTCSAPAARPPCPA